MWNGAVRTAVCQKADAGTDKGRIYCKTDDSEKRREEFCETDGGGSGEIKWGHGTGSLESLRKNSDLSWTHAWIIWKLYKIHTIFKE